jgi:predicted nucleotidyltransferase
MTPRFGLKETTLQKICGVFAAYPQVEKALIYGSRARGNYKNGSDIDLTLYGSALTLNILHKIMTDIDDLLLPYRVDLSLFHVLSDPDFIDHIQRMGVVFYEKAGERIPV